MTAFDTARDIMSTEQPGAWVFWHLTGPDPTKFELVQIYKGDTEFIKHGLFFDALDRTDATRLCRNLMIEFGMHGGDIIKIVGSVTDELRKLAGNKKTKTKGYT